jgi:UDP-glucose 4-epimerase
MDYKDKHIFVTGGAGFIGSHFVEAISKTNQVTVYDNFSSSVIPIGDLSNIRNVKVIKGDILERKMLEKAMHGVDSVFHFAVACVRLSLSDERYVHDVNATGTLNALLAAKAAGVRRFIYISSSEVYGTAKGGRMNEAHPITPTTVYGASKYVGELYTKHFNDMEGLPAIIVRPFNTYGPGSHFDGVYGEVIPRFSVRAINGKQPIIFGSGNQTRDFTYVSDTVAGIIRAAGEDKLLGDVINIARGQEVSVSGVAKTICGITGLPFAPVMKPARPNDVFRHYADITKAKKLLSFKPEVAITAGLDRYISWVKKTYPDRNSLIRQIPDINW